MGSLAEEELFRSLTAANDEANSRANDLDKQLKDAKSDLKALEDADKENVQLRTDNDRLKLELMTQRNMQADELAKEQTRMTEENERDNLARLKITGGLLYPEIDFESGSTRPSPSKQSRSKIQKTGTGDVSASGKNRKYIAYKPKRGDNSTLEANREVSKPDATQALKAPVQRPTVVQMAKEMLRALDLEEKASVRGVGTLILDAILGNLYEADANLQLKIGLDSARSKIIDLKAEIKGLKEKLEPLQEDKKEAERAKERVGRLEMRLANKEKQLKAKSKSRAEEEKEALVKQMMEDCESIMRMAWEAV
ncbi:uncharacterized protein LOC110690256 [Chenopodium quinoa]|uniref:uncharacterized protein LOC110690256 n=1 Tax=Chenopodium quinoa TaxID=63459 RepID=UPI000B78B589|nr:uncharacterized protein LOC110690256 [Chenopodium quinoa]